MRYLTKINLKLFGGILLLLALLSFISAAVQQDVQVIFFFAVVYIATMGHLVIDRLIQRHKTEALARATLIGIWRSFKTQVRQLRSERKIGKGLMVGILLVLSLTFAIGANLASGGRGNEIIAFCLAWTFIVLAFFAADRYIQKRRARRPAAATEVPQGVSTLGEDSPQPRRKLKIVIGILLLWALIMLLAGTSQSDSVPELVMAISFMVASIGTLGYLVVDRFIQKRKVRELKEASLRAEVDSLKTQINPHFFFNTLNNLYGLTVEKSDSAPEVILKLSDMMRYTIYEGEKDRVALKDEIAYLENYIELQKIRFHRPPDIKFEHFIEETDIKVPPLLFIVLVENAFKHGAESLTDSAYIHIKLMSMNGSVLFETQNNFEADDTDKSGGIGLKNLQRRLQLLFPDEYTFLLDGTSQGVYKTTLKFKAS